MPTGINFKDKILTPEMLEDYFNQVEQLVSGAENSVQDVAEPHRRPFAQFQQNFDIDSVPGASAQRKLLIPDFTDLVAGAPVVPSALSHIKVLPQGGRIESDGVNVTARYVDQPSWTSRTGDPRPGVAFELHLDVQSSQIVNAADFGFDPRFGLVLTELWYKDSTSTTWKSVRLRDGRPGQLFEPILARSIVAVIHSPAGAFIEVNPDNEPREIAIRPQDIRSSMDIMSTEETSSFDQSHFLHLLRGVQPRLYSVSGPWSKELTLAQSQPGQGLLASAYVVHDDAQATMLHGQGFTDRYVRWRQEDEGTAPHTVILDPNSHVTLTRAATTILSKGTYHAIITSTLCGGYTYARNPDQREDGRVWHKHVRVNWNDGEQHDLLSSNLEEPDDNQFFDPSLASTRPFTFILRRGAEVRFYVEQEPTWSFPLYIIIFPDTSRPNMDILGPGDWINIPCARPAGRHLPGGPQKNRGWFDLGSKNQNLDLRARLTIHVDAIPEDGDSITLTIDGTTHNFLARNSPQLPNEFQIESTIRDQIETLNSFLSRVIPETSVVDHEEGALIVSHGADLTYITITDTTLSIILDIGDGTADSWSIDLLDGGSPKTIKQIASEIQSLEFFGGGTNARFVADALDPDAEATTLIPVSRLPLLVAGSGIVPITQTSRQLESLVLKRATGVTIIPDRIQTQEVHAETSSVSSGESLRISLDGYDTVGLPLDLVQIEASSIGKATRVWAYAFDHRWHYLGEILVGDQQRSQFNARIEAQTIQMIRLFVPPTPEGGLSWASDSLFDPVQEDTPTRNEYRSILLHEDSVVEIGPVLRPNTLVTARVPLIRSTRNHSFFDRKAVTQISSTQWRSSLDLDIVKEAGARIIFDHHEGSLSSVNGQTSLTDPHSSWERILIETEFQFLQTGENSGDAPGYVHIERTVMDSDHVEHTYSVKITATDNTTLTYEFMHDNTVYKTLVDTDAAPKQRTRIQLAFVTQPGVTFSTNQWRLYLLEWVGDRFRVKARINYQANSDHYPSGDLTGSEPAPGVHNNSPRTHTIKLSEATLFYYLLREGRQIDKPYAKRIDWSGHDVQVPEFDRIYDRRSILATTLSDVKSYEWIDAGPKKLLHPESQVPDIDQRGVVRRAYPYFLPEHGHDFPATAAFDSDRLFLELSPYREPTHTVDHIADASIMEEPGEDFDPVNKDDDSAQDGNHVIDNDRWTAHSDNDPDTITVGSMIKAIPSKNLIVEAELSFQDTIDSESKAGIVLIEDWPDANLKLEVHTNRLSTPSGVITNISVNNPTVITCPNHGFLNSEIVEFIGTNSTPAVSGRLVITKVDENTFTVPVNVTVAGDTGKAYHSWSHASLVKHNWRRSPHLRLFTVSTHNNRVGQGRILGQVERYPDASSDKLKLRAVKDGSSLWVMRHGKEVFAWNLIHHDGTGSPTSATVEVTSEEIILSITGGSSDGRVDRISLHQNPTLGDLRDSLESIENASVGWVLNTHTAGVLNNDLPSSQVMPMQSTEALGMSEEPDRLRLFWASSNPDRWMTLFHINLSNGSASQPDIKGTPSSGTELDGTTHSQIVHYGSSWNSVILDNLRPGVITQKKHQGYIHYLASGRIQPNHDAALYKGPEKTIIDLAPFNSQSSKYVRGWSLLPNKRQLHNTHVVFLNDHTEQYSDDFIYNLNRRLLLHWLEHRNRPDGANPAHPSISYRQEGMAPFSKSVNNWHADVVEGIDNLAQVFNLDGRIVHQVPITGGLFRLPEPHRLFLPAGSTLWVAGGDVRVYPKNKPRLHISTVIMALDGAPIVRSTEVRYFLRLGHRELPILPFPRTFSDGWLLDPLLNYDEAGNWGASIEPITTNVAPGTTLSATDLNHLSAMLLSAETPLRAGQDFTWTHHGSYDRITLLNRGLTEIRAYYPVNSRTSSVFHWIQDHDVDDWIWTEQMYEVEDSRIIDLREPVFAPSRYIQVQGIPKPRTGQNNHLFAITELTVNGEPATDRTNYTTWKPPILREDRLEFYTDSSRILLSKEVTGRVEVKHPILPSAARLIARMTGQPWPVSSWPRFNRVESTFAYYNPGRSQD